MTLARIATLLLVATIAVSFTKADMDQSQRTKQKNRSTQEDSLLRHVVLFKFKEDSPSQAIEEIKNAFSKLPSNIPEVYAYEWGLNNSPEGLNKDFTHCFLVTFKSEEDRAVYLPHPDHMAFVELLKPHLADVLVVDYWSK